MIDYFEKCFCMKRSAIGISLLLCLYLISVCIISGIVICCLFFLGDIFRQIPSFLEMTFLPFFNQFFMMLKERFTFINQDHIETIIHFFQNFMLDSISSFSSFLTQIPQFFFSFFIFIMATFFLVIDYEDIRDTLITIMPSHLLQSFHVIKNRSLESIIIYVRCQFIIMLITFLILSFAFFIMKMHYPLFYALLTAFLDSLPVIGIGIVLIPIGFVYCFQKAYLKAIYILLIYIFLNVLRSFLEPQLMNKHMKIPSFVLLFSMVIHLHFFGMIGLFLSPIHMSLIYSSLES